jgi:hypothetical protein
VDRTSALGMGVRLEGLIHTRSWPINISTPIRPSTRGVNLHTRTARLLRSGRPLRPLT